MKKIVPVKPVGKIISQKQTTPVKNVTAQNQRGKIKGSNSKSLTR